MLATDPCVALAARLAKHLRHEDVVRCATGADCEGNFSLSSHDSLIDLKMNPFYSRNI